MLRYFFQRFLLGFFALLVACVLVFFLSSVFGRDPILENLDTFRNSFPQNTPTSTILEVVREREGFNLSVTTRFFLWVKGIFAGSAGKVFSSPGTSIAETFFRPLKYTLWVTLPSLVISETTGILLGFWAAYRRGKFSDRVITLLSNVFIGIPSFITANIIMLFTLSTGLPAQFRRPGDLGNTYLDMFLSLIGPYIALILPSVAGSVVFVRNLCVSTLTSNHVLIARAKGLNKAQVFFKHVMKNVLVPIIPGLITSFIFLLEGSLVIEQIYGIPGSSRLFITWQNSGEINVTMFTILSLGVLSRIGQIFGDIFFALLEPTVRLNTQQRKAGFILLFFHKIKNRYFLPSAKRFKLKVVNQ